MTILKLQFAGEIKKAEHKTAAGKQLVEVSLCKANRKKEGEQDTFTWIRVSIWEPADFQAPKLIKGSFIAGSGDMTHRSYMKDGQKGHAIELSCRSFDIEVSDGSARSNAPAAAPASAPRRPAPPAPSTGDDEPPF